MEFVSNPLAVAGTIALAIAVAAWLGDHRRMRRSEPDAVGFMPWTSLFFWSLLLALVTFSLAARAWIAG